MSETLQQLAIKNRFYSFSGAENEFDKIEDWSAEHEQGYSQDSEGGKDGLKENASDMARCSVLYMQTKTSLPFKKILNTQHRDSLKRDINKITFALQQS